MEAGFKLDTIIHEKVMHRTGKPLTYSLSDSAAWEVIACLDAKQILFDHTKEKWGVRIAIIKSSGGVAEPFDGVGDTPAHAICLAALKAVGVEA